GPGCSVERALAAPAGGEAEHLAAGDRSFEPTEWVNRGQRVEKVLVARGARERRLLAGKAIPDLGVLRFELMVGGAHPAIMPTAAHRPKRQGGRARCRSSLAQAPC